MQRAVRRDAAGCGARVSTSIFGIACRIALKTRRRVGFGRLHVALDSLLEIGGGADAAGEPVGDLDLTSGVMAMTPGMRRPSLSGRSPAALTRCRPRRSRDVARGAHVMSPAALT